MGDKTSIIFFIIFYWNSMYPYWKYLDYYIAGSIIGTVFNVIGILLWVILIIYKFTLEKKK